MASVPTLRGSSRRTLGIIALITTAVLGLTGCQVGGNGMSDTEVAEGVALPALDSLIPIDDPTSYVGPTTAVVGEASIEPIDPLPAELPTTVLSHDRGGDVEVEVTDNSRVLALSLSGSLAEMVYSYGMADHLVGRDISTNFPGTEDLPIVTKGGHSIDAEGIMSLDPTLIVSDGTVGPVDVLLQLRELGVPVVMVDRAVDAETTYETSRQVAAALGVPEAAEIVNAEIAEEIAITEAEVAALLPDDPAKLPRVAFLYIRGTAGIYYLFGEGSGVDSMIESVGAIDVAEEIGWKGEKPMTDEALVALDPDVILVMSKGLESAGGVDGLIAAQPSVANTTAGKNRRIVDIDDAVLFAGGTRIPDVIDGLARALYAPDSLADVSGGADASE